MRTRVSAVRLLILLVAVLLLGACTPQQPADDPDDGPGTPTPTPVATPETTPADEGEDDATSADPTGGSLADDVLLVWTRGELAEGLATGVAGIDGVGATTVVLGSRAGLLRTVDADGATVDEAPDGWEIPVEVLAVDPTTIGEVVEGPAGELLAGIDDDAALLTTTSAALRGVGPGARIEITDRESARHTLTVTGVVPDEVAGAGEIVVSASSPIAAGAPPRYLLARHDGDRESFEEEVRRRLPPGTGVRVRSRDETPILRHADAVRPQSHLKARFGEFPVRTVGGGIEQHPAWIEENITTGSVPVLGTVRCHRRLIPLLTDAMVEIEERGLAELLDPDDTAGCHEDREIAGDDALSRHAWGVAIDVNASTNPFGAEPQLDERIVGIMEEHGFAWGGHWLVPDGMHFEWFGDE